MLLSSETPDVICLQRQLGDCVYIIACKPLDQEDTTEAFGSLQCRKSVSFAGSWISGGHSEREMQVHPRDALHCRQ